MGQQPIVNKTPGGSQWTLGNMGRAASKAMTLGTGNPWLAALTGTAGLAGLGYLAAPNLIRRMNPENDEETKDLRNRGMGLGLALGGLGTAGLVGIGNWDKIRSMWKGATCIEKKAVYSWSRSPGTEHIGLHGMMNQEVSDSFDPSIRVPLLSSAMMAAPSGNRQSGLINPWDVANVMASRGLLAPATTGLASAALGLSQGHTQSLGKVMGALMPLMTTGVLSSSASRGLGSALGANALALMGGM